MEWYAEVDQFECARNPKMRRKMLRLDRDAEEDPADVPAFEPWNVGLIVAMFLSEVVAFVHDVPRRIDMSVDKDRVRQQPLQSLVGRLREGCGGK